LSLLNRDRKSENGSTTLTIPSEVEGLTANA
jgi:hypothetical protein